MVAHHEHNLVGFGGVVDMRDGIQPMLLQMFCDKMFKGFQIISLGEFFLETLDAMALGL